MYRRLFSEFEYRARIIRRFNGITCSLVGMAFPAARGTSEHQRLPAGTGDQGEVIERPDPASRIVLLVRFWRIFNDEIVRGEGREG